MFKKIKDLLKPVYTPEGKPKGQATIVEASTNPLDVFPDETTK